MSVIPAPSTAPSNACAPNSARQTPKPTASSRCAGWDIGSTQRLNLRKSSCPSWNAMQTIRTRLSLNYFLVLLLGMMLAGVLAWLAVERLYVKTQRENLLAQARLIAASLQGSPLPTEAVQPYSQTSNVAPGVHTRVLSEGGAIVVGLPLEDAFTLMPAAEQYASIPTADLIRRSEIDSALNGTPATAIRRVL